MHRFRIDPSFLIQVGILTTSTVLMISDLFQWMVR
ncbi:Uncharacterised protein [Mycobacteroides abscessus subsp. abscessus]|nr:Uncharacterised protein [Mycobacteroides abscessus subsp. abscessus]